MVLYRKMQVSEEQAIIMLRLLASEILGSPQISLTNLPRAVFNYFDLPDIMAIAQKHNGELWDYQYRMMDAYLVLYLGDFLGR